MPATVNQYFLCKNFFSSLYLNTKNEALLYTVKAITQQIKSMRDKRSTWSNIFLINTWKKRHNENKLLHFLQDKKNVADQKKNFRCYM